jgi:hypothetical protein
MSEPRYTSDQLVDGVSNALRAKNFPAVVDLLTALALQDPTRAEQVLTTIEAGLLIASEDRKAVVVPEPANRLVPDVEDVRDLWRQAEELVLWLWRAEDVEENEVRWLLPDPVGDSTASNALDRVLEALRQHLDVMQQYSSAPSVPRRRLLAPDGRYEHLPLRVVPVDQADLEILSAAVAVMNQALASQPPDGAGRVQQHMLIDLRQRLESFDPDPLVWPHPTPDTPAGYLRPLARLIAVLDLPADEDTALLLDTLSACPDQDVVFAPRHELAYQRVARRLNLLLADSDPLGQFQY